MSNQWLTPNEPRIYNSTKKAPVVKFSSQKGVHSGVVGGESGLSGGVDNMNDRVYGYDSDACIRLLYNSTCSNDQVYTPYLNTTHTETGSSSVKNDKKGEKVMMMDTIPVSMTRTIHNVLSTDDVGSTRKKFVLEGHLKQQQQQQKLQEPMPEIDLASIMTFPSMPELRRENLMITEILEDEEEDQSTNAQPRRLGTYQNTVKSTHALPTPTQSASSEMTSGLRKILFNDKNRDNNTTIASTTIGNTTTNNNNTTNDNTRLPLLSANKDPASSIDILHQIAIRGYTSRNVPRHVTRARSQYGTKEAVGSKKNAMITPKDVVIPSNNASIPSLADSEEISTSNIVHRGQHTSTNANSVLSRSNSAKKQVRQYYEPGIYPSSSSEQEELNTKKYDALEKQKKTRTTHKHKYHATSLASTEPELRPSLHSPDFVEIKLKEDSLTKFQDVLRETNTEVQKNKIQLEANKLDGEARAQLLREDMRDRHDMYLSKLYGLSGSVAVSPTKKHVSIPIVPNPVVDNNKTQPTVYMRSHPSVEIYRPRYDVLTPSLRALQTKQHSQSVSAIEKMQLQFQAEAHDLINEGYDVSTVRISDDAKLPINGRSRTAPTIQAFLASRVNQLRQNQSHITQATQSSVHAKTEEIESLLKAMVDDELERLVNAQETFKTDMSTTHMLDKLTRDEDLVHAVGLVTGVYAQASTVSSLAKLVVNGTVPLGLEGFYAELKKDDKAAFFQRQKREKDRQIWNQGVYSQLSPVHMTKQPMTVLRKGTTLPWVYLALQRGISVRKGRVVSPFPSDPLSSVGDQCLHTDTTPAGTKGAHVYILEHGQLVRVNTHKQAKTPEVYIDRMKSRIELTNVYGDSMHGDFQWKEVLQHAIPSKPVAMDIATGIMVQNTQVLGTVFELAEERWNAADVVLVTVDDCMHASQDLPLVIEECLSSTYLYSGVVHTVVVNVDVDFIPMLRNNSSNDVQVRKVSKKAMYTENQNHTLSMPPSSLFVKNKLPLDLVHLLLHTPRILPSARPESRWQHWWEESARARDLAFSQNDLFRVQDQRNARTTRFKEPKHPGTRVSANYGGNASATTVGGPQYVEWVVELCCGCSGRGVCLACKYIVTTGVVLKRPERKYEAKWKAEQEVVLPQQQREATKKLQEDDSVTLFASPKPMQSQRPPSSTDQVVREGDTSDEEAYLTEEEYDLDQFSEHLQDEDQETHHPRTAHPNDQPDEVQQLASDFVDGLPNFTFLNENRENNTEQRNVAESVPCRVLLRTRVYLREDVQEVLGHTTKGAFHNVEPEQAVMNVLKSFNDSIQLPEATIIGAAKNAFQPSANVAESVSELLGGFDTSKILTKDSAVKTLLTSNKSSERLLGARKEQESIVDNKDLEFLEKEFTHIDLSAHAPEVVVDKTPPPSALTIACQNAMSRVDIKPKNPKYTVKTSDSTNLRSFEAQPLQRVPDMVEVTRVVVDVSNTSMLYVDKHLEVSPIPKNYGDLLFKESMASEKIENKKQIAKKPGNTLVPQTEGHTVAVQALELRNTTVPTLDESKRKEHVLENWLDGHLELPDNQIDQLLHCVNGSVVKTKPAIQPQKNREFHSEEVSPDIATATLQRQTNDTRHSYGYDRIPIFQELYDAKSRQTLESQGQTPTAKDVLVSGNISSLLNLSKTESVYPYILSSRVAGASASTEVVAPRMTNGNRPTNVYTHEKEVSFAMAPTNKSHALAQLHTQSVRMTNDSAKHIISTIDTLAHNQDIQNITLAVSHKRS